MFWVGVTHCRCRKILSCDAPGSPNRSLENNYLTLLSDLGVSGFPEIRLRCTEIERALPRICGLAEVIIAANGEVEDD